MKDLFNRYSLTLLIIMGMLLICGGMWLYSGNLIGLAPLIMGGLMFQGFRTPDPSPRRVWLITFFGQKTKTKVENLVLLLDWLPIRIIGIVEFLMVKVDHDFPLKKPIRCSDGAYVYGFVSVSMLPDEKDDPPTAIQWKSGGEKLQDFDNAGQMDGVKKQLDDILTAWIQEFGDKHDSEWMERNGLQIANELRPRVEGLQGTDNGNNSALDDTRGLGVTFTKFQIILNPSDKIIDARNDLKVEEAQQKAELFETQTVNKQINERMAIYARPIKDADGTVLVPAEPPPTRTEARNMVFQERLEKDGKVQLIINDKGINLVNVNTGGQGGNS